MSDHEQSDSRNNRTGLEDEAGKEPGEYNSYATTKVDSLINATVKNYQIISLIGKGGFGNVYKARDASLERDVAIKFLWGKPDEVRRSFFEREAKAIAALGKHPNIVNIYQWDEYEGKNFIVLEYVDSNAVRLMEEHPHGLPLAMALRIAMECAEALNEAHRNRILHRDIKPANILIESDSGNAKLTDFGIARFGTSNELTLQGSISGSPPYMSPEQASAKVLDERSDIYSLGITLYELLCGKRPFEGISPEDIIERILRNQRITLQQRRPDLPKEICAIVEKAIAYEPENRYQNAGEMAKQLRFVLQSLDRSGTVAGGANTDTSLAPPKRHRTFFIRPAVIKVLAAVSIMVLLIYGTTWTRGLKTTTMQHSHAIEAAEISMNKEDFSGAIPLFKEILEDEPENDLARYGYCLALAHTGKIQDASAIATSIQSPQLQTDVAATVAFLSLSSDARATIERLDESHPTRYIQTLLARLDVLDGNYTHAVERLGILAGEQFIYDYQYLNALEALGQAHYRLGQYTDAKTVFQQVLTANDGNATRSTSQAYLNELNSRLNEERRENIFAKAAAIKQKIEQIDIQTEAHDEWTSRPLTFAVLPGEIKRSRIAAESGIADLLPLLLGNLLDANTPMQVVDRELLQEILTEQALSGMLSTNEGRLRLGRFLGARLFLKCNFVRIGMDDKAIIIIDDVETTERIPVPPQDIQLPVEVDSVVNAYAKIIWERVSNHFPERGRLYKGADGPQINIGAAMGVVPGMTFDILADPDLPPLPGVKAVVLGSPGNTMSQVEVHGMDLNTIETTPEGGWFVCVRPDGAS